jgi:hypothetical protein
MCKVINKVLLKYFRYLSECPLSHPFLNRMTEEVCSICRETLNSENKTSLTLDCDHTFHGKCISKWFTQSNQCPICRKDYFEKISSSSSSYPFPPVILSLDKIGEALLDLYNLYILLRVLHGQLFTQSIQTIFLRYITLDTDYDIISNPFRMPSSLNEFKIFEIALCLPFVYVSCMRCGTFYRFFRVIVEHRALFIVSLIISGILA